MANWSTSSKIPRQESPFRCDCSAPKPYCVCCGFLLRLYYLQLSCIGVSMVVVDLLLFSLMQAPQLDINTVAAGGGSKLFFRSGLFVVGPDSCGANPGLSVGRRAFLRIVF